MGVSIRLCKNAWGRLPVCLGIALSVIFTVQNCIAKGETTSKELITVTPILRTDENWMDKHNKLVARAKKGDVDIAFFGDSITEGMNETLLHQIFGDKAEHFGIGGDRTQNMLWRLRNGELDFGGTAPKQIVVLMGTNNLSTWKDNPSNPPADIAKGVKINLDEMRSKLPNANILLLGILPRDEKPNTSMRKRLKETNVLLKKLADKKHIWYTDIGSSLLQKDGTISKEIMPDFLHPSAQQGYEAMFKAIKPELDAMK